MSDETVGYDPFSVEVMADPYPMYRELRARYRAYRLDEYDAWALPRFADVWDVLADRTRLSVVEGPVFHRGQLLRHHEHAPEPPPRPPVPSFAQLDPPTHTRARQAMVAPFRPRAIGDLESDVRAIAAARLDQLVPRGRFDVRHDYASPVAAAVSALMLGVPIADAPALARLVNRFAQRVPGQSGISEDGLVARRELYEYLVGLVAARRRGNGHHGNDVVDGLLALDVGSGPLSDAEVADQLGTLFIGGTETLPKVLAGGAHQLWRSPEQRAAVSATPALAGGAFEEMLRVELPLQFVGRTLLVDAEFAGVPMRAGQRVLLLLISANRDEDEFIEPDQFDVRRGMERHLGFGHGGHVCIGAHLARLEGTVMLQEFLARCPDYEVDDAELVREASEFQVGWAAMPIVFDPVH